MGTRKYPSENGWSKLLSRHGGNFNAETDNETTCYYFDCHPDYLRSVLERFGSFFTCPLFKWSASSREAQAVHNEFEIATQDEIWREGHVFADLARADNPTIKKFRMGNAQTLVDEPKAAKVDVRAELLKFHTHFYSANLMTAVLIGKEPLDTLQQWAVDAFGGTPNLCIERPRVRTYATWNRLEHVPIDPKELPMVVNIVPLTQKRDIALHWFLPPQESPDHFKCKPCDVIGNLVGHEGRGSVLAHLKEKGLATALMAGPMRMSSAYCQFEVVVELTKAGVFEIDYIVQAICCYVGMISARKAPPRWVWEEQRDVNALEFKFTEDGGELDMARGLALSMQARHPPEETLSADSLTTEYIPDLVETALEHMVPEMLAVTIRERCGEHPSTDRLELPPDDISTYTKEPWMEVQYKKSAVGPSRLAAWRSAYDEGRLSGSIESDEPLTHRSPRSGPAMAGLASHFHLPFKNEFVPTDFELRHHPATAAGEGPKAAADPSEGSASASPTTTSTTEWKETVFGTVTSTTATTTAAIKPEVGAAGGLKKSPPSLLRNSADASLWFLPGKRWPTPRAVLSLTLVALRRGGFPTIHEEIMMQLFVNLILEELNEESYAATIAGLGYEVGSGPGTYGLAAHGFSHKAPALLLRVCEVFMDIAAKPVNEKLFNQFLERERQFFLNAGSTSMDRLGMMRDETLIAPYYTVVQKLEAIAEITPERLSAFLRAELLPGVVSSEGQTGQPHLHVSCYVAGNLNEAEANELYEGALKVLGVPLPHAPMPDLPSEEEWKAATDALKAAPSGYRPTPPSVPGIRPSRGLALPAGSGPMGHCIRTASRSPSELNQSVDVYWYLGSKADYATLAKAALLESLIGEPFFDQLRTKEQLGYVAYCSAAGISEGLYLTAHVTSSTALPVDIETSIRAFIGKWVPRISSISGAQFAETLEAEVATTLHDDHSMFEEAGRYLAEIKTREYVWERGEAMAAHLRGIKQAELATWANSLVLGGEARVLSIHVYAGTEASAEKLEAKPVLPGAKALSEADVPAFKATLEELATPFCLMPVPADVRT